MFVCFATSYRVYLSYLYEEIAQLGGCCLVEIGQITAVLAFGFWMGHLLRIFKKASWFRSACNSQDCFVSKLAELKKSYMPSQ